MTKILPAAEMGLAEAGITAIFGYIVVFSGLLILMILLYIMAAIFKLKANKTEKENSEPAERAKVSEQITPASTAPGSAGHIKLFDVPDKEAAMIMAIVADKVQKPLNELHFISIKEVKNDEV